jgi:hypothetical protein
MRRKISYITIAILTTIAIQVIRQINIDMLMKQLFI